MAMVRERRHQQALTLPLPPPSPPSPPQSPPPFSRLPAGPTALSDLDRLSVLGRGSAGTVYKVLHRPSSSILALKVPHETSPDSLREADILRRLDSPYLVRCHAVLHDQHDQLCFAMECMQRGSLRDLLHARHRLPEPGIAELARRVLQGLSYLQAMGIVHGDINPSNLLIGDKGEVKIADFGGGGTCAYMSPERFDGEGFGGGGDGGGFAGDVWGVGVVVLECYLGRFPLVGAGERADWATLMCRVCFNDMMEVPGTASPEFRGFVGRCLEKEWRRRGTVGELLAHPFLVKAARNGGD